jgi:hypothetical protein
MRHKLSTSRAFSCLWTLLIGAILLGSAACAPKLGDGCKRPQECSVNGDRTCDQSQPGGYCTIPDCSSGSCPDDGVCVRFQPDEPRLARSWCMASCDNTRDCDRDRYVCRTADTLNEDASKEDESAASIAVVLDSNSGRKFCVVDSEE